MTKHLPKKSGIYAIRHIASDKRYVGSAMELRGRCQNHYGLLTKNQHHCRHLQRAWNKYGEDTFVFEVLEFVPDESLLVETEQKYIDLFGEYNSAPKAGNQLGFRHTPESLIKMSSWKRKPVPQEQKARQAVAMAEVWGTEEYRNLAIPHMQAAKRSPEKRKAVSDTMKRICKEPAMHDRLKRNADAQRSPERRKAQSERMTAVLDTPEAKARMSAASKNKWADDPEAKRKVSEAVKARWADPEYKARISAKIRQNWGKNREE